MGGSAGYRARLRFRVQKLLNIQEEKHRFDIAGRTIELAARDKKSLISKSEWIVADMRGFESIEDARSFVTSLKTAIDISSVAARLGVDTGVNRATSGFGQWVKDKIQQEHGCILRDDIHGIDVFPEEPIALFGYVSAQGVVLAAPDPFLADLKDYLEIPQPLSKTTADVVLLLNYALMRPEAVAQIVFAISAVEMIGQKEGWSVDQRQLLERLAEEAERSDIGQSRERQQVAEAVRREIQRFSLRRGVFTLLDELRLGALKGKWDKLYAERSRLVHGLAPEPGANYSDLATQAVGLCGYILLKVIAREVPAVDRYADRYYRP